MSLKSKEGFYPFLGRKSNSSLLVAFLFLMCGTGGATLTEKEPERLKGLKNPAGLNNPAVKTIMTEDGDIIDCVEIYKQPAFDHPLLRNHTIKMRPSFIPRVADGNSSLRFLTQQIWQKNGSCPIGTIPIQRIRETDFIRISDSSKNFSLNAEFANCKVEIARVENHRGGPHFGAQGTISVWNLDVMMMEWSLNSVTVFDVHDSFMEAGWAVGPVLFEDVKPRLFVNWLDTSADMGCFNLRCPGFVQVSNWIVLGGVLPKISTFDGDQFSFTFTTYYDAVQDKWWMLFEGEPVGYWPSSLFENWVTGPRVNWGGSVCNTEYQNYHTMTQMGSGHFPREGWRRASYVRNLIVMLPKLDPVPPRHYKNSATSGGCYNVGDAAHFPGDLGPAIYYGGPGGKCCNGGCKR